VSHNEHVTRGLLPACVATAAAVAVGLSVLTAAAQIPTTGGQASQTQTSQTPPQTTTPASLPAPAGTPPPAPPALPVNIDKIRLKLEQHPTSSPLEQPRLHFYAEVTPKEITFWDWTRGYDLTNGLAPQAAGLTPDSFARMTTPEGMYSTGIAHTNILPLLTGAFNKIRNAKDAHQVNAIRERIEKELTALNAKNGGSQ
jgi:hypothetical protein